MYRHWSHRQITLLLLILGLSSSSFAFDLPDKKGEPELSSTSKDPEPWREQGWELPPYPGKQGLYEVEPEQHVPLFRFWIDSNSISIGADGVIRYAMVVTAARSWARNVRFEGLLCGEEQYRVYAYGTADRTWREVRNSDWQPFASDPSNPIRIALKKNYFCKEGTGHPLPLDRILTNLRQGGDAGQNSTTGNSSASVTAQRSAALWATSFSSR